MSQSKGFAPAAVRTQRPTDPQSLRERPPEAARGSLADVLVALSSTFDLLEGHPLGHTSRAAVIGMRLGRELGLPPAMLSALYYALLLKDAGGSANAARVAALFGADDQQVKPALRRADWRSALTRAHVGWTYGGQGEAQGASLSSRFRILSRVAWQPGLARDLMAARSEQGADVARRLGLPEDTARGIRSMDERWDGSGFPDGVAGDAIPLLSRILNVAQFVDTVMATRGKDTAIDRLVSRRGRWFDPALVDCMRSWRREAGWWGVVWTSEADGELAALDPSAGGPAIGEDGLDRVAGVFADIIDAKSPFTHAHSTTVARYAEAIGWELGFNVEAVRLVRRAALLHDIGKVALSNRLLDKPGALTDTERLAIQTHPRHTFQILSRVELFAAMAHMAATHHEKLDGSGYPWGLQGDMLTLPARVLVVADMLEALTGCGPCREGMPIERALGILHSERGTRLDADCVDAAERLVAAGMVEAGVPQPGLATAIHGGGR